MKIFWNDCGDELPSEAAKAVDLPEALRVWTDVVRGVEGNFLGLIDNQNRTIQFYFESGIPDDVEDARLLQIVLMDLPQPGLGGSYGKTVSIGEVGQLIETAFAKGADHRAFGDLPFTSW
jgi:hypothetical protein